MKCMRSQITVIQGSETILQFKKTNWLNEVCLCIKSEPQHCQISCHW